MKTLTVRLPENVVAEIEAESRLRNVSKSDVVRERLQQPYQTKPRKGATTMELIGDLIGPAKGPTTFLSDNKKKHLPALIRAKKLHR